MDETVLVLPNFTVFWQSSVQRQLTEIIIIVIYKSKIKFYIIFVSRWRAGSLIQEQKFPLVDKFCIFMFYIYIEHEIKIVTYDGKELVRSKPLLKMDQGKRTKNSLR